jgi:hypothetical protein
VEDGALLPYVVHLERMNDQNFKDQERMLEELKPLFSLSLSTFLAPSVISFNDFFFSLLDRLFSCVLGLFVFLIIF